jgi:hypothetical protein
VRIDFADHGEQTGKTALGLVPVPLLEEIAAKPDFEPEAISAQEFESMWQKAKTGRQ